MDKLRFKNCATVLNMVANTMGTNSKKSILTRFRAVPDLELILKHLYNPYVTTGIKDKSLDEACSYVICCSPCQSRYNCLEDFILDLQHDNTGSNYALERAALMYKWAYDISEEAGWLMRGIITKNLQIGVKAQTLNQIFGKGFIPLIGIMRGMIAPDNLAGVYIATEKIDGNRRLIMNKPTGVEIYTRSGRRDYGLVELEEQAKKYLPTGYVYDTECVAKGDFVDNIALRQATASLLNKQGIRKGVLAKVFDCIKQNEYDEGISSEYATIRKLRIAKLFNDTEGVNKLTKICQNGIFLHEVLLTEPVPTECDCFVGLPILGIVYDKQEALELAKPVWNNNGEGLMLVERNSAYEVNPNPRKTLLKIKATEETVVLVTDVVEGTNSNEGRLGAVEVQFVGRDGKTYTFNVGSGFTQYERDYYWRHPEEIIGYNIEVEHFGESINKQGLRALNCPIFKRIVGDTER